MPIVDFSNHDVVERWGAVPLAALRLNYIYQDIPDQGITVYAYCGENDEFSVSSTGTGEQVHGGQPFVKAERVRHPSKRM